MLPQSRLLPFLAAFLLSIACGRQTMQDLMTIETYVEAAPDSALVRLAAMDTSAFSAREDAWHRYLTSLGRYKAYVDEYDDAPISRAEAWFRAHGDKTRLMKTLYLKGYIEYNAKDYNDAVISLTEGLRLAEMQGDDFYAGLCCRELGAVFAATFSEKEALDYDLMSYDYFKRGEHGVHARYQLLSVGQSYTRLGKIPEANKSYLETVQVAKECKDSVLWARAARGYALNLVGNGDPNVPIEMMTFVIDSLHYPIGSGAYAYLGRAYALSGNDKAARHYLAVADANAVSKREKYVVDYQRYLSELALSEPQAALSAVEKVLEYATGDEYREMDEIAAQSQIDYIQEQEYLLELENTVARQRVIMIVAGSIFLVVFLILGSLYVIHKINERRTRLQQEKEELINHIKHLTVSHSSELKESAKSGMRFFNILAQTYWQGQNHKIVPVFERILEGLVSDEDIINQLIITINKTRNNLMVRLADQIPSLKETELMLYCYLASQLGHNTICLILDKNPGAVNAQVYRLRNKIAGSDAPDKAEFLDAIAK